MSVRNMLTMTGTVKTPTITQSVIGGAKKAFVNSYSSMPCMLNVSIGSRMGSEGREFGKRTTRGDFILYIEPNDSAKAITKSDRIIIGSRTFEVVGVPYNVSNRDVLFHIGLEEIL